MIYHVLELIGIIWTKMQNLLSNFFVADGISYWSILIVSFVAFGFIRILATATGATGLSGMASGTIRAADASQKRIALQKSKQYKSN